jgi:acetyltransferase-like isoleucine patch superfamily enzyme
MENYYKLPSEDVNDQEAQIVAINKNNGDLVSMGDIIYSFETTKAIVDVESENNGYIFYLANLLDTLSVGSDICVITSNENFDIEKKLSELDTSGDEKGYKLTKKAEAFIQSENLNIDDYQLKGVVKVDDLLKAMNKNDSSTIQNSKKVLLIDKSNDFIQLVENDEAIKNLPSSEKIELYRDNGHIIGNNVFIGLGTIIVSNNIRIDDGVSIGEDNFIEVPNIEIGRNTTIGNRCNIVASELSIGSYNRIIDGARIDLSGGRNLDSNLITGRGCLLSSYINVCREVKLGENVALSPDSIIFTHSYWQSVLDGYPASYGPVSFGDNSWLGAGSYVLPNTKIGKGSVIMSASLVASDVKEYTMVGGTPAQLVKNNLKKNKTNRQINEDLSKLYQELALWFDMNQYDIEIEDQDIFIVRHENKEIKCGFINTSNELKNNGKYNDCEIIISLNLSKEESFTGKTLLIISEKKVIGNLSPIVDSIINFYRHRGIRLYK